MFPSFFYRLGRVQRLIYEIDITHRDDSRVVKEESFSKWLSNKVWDGHKTLSKKRFYLRCNFRWENKNSLSQWGLRNLRILNWLFDMRVWGFTSSLNIDERFVEPFLRFSWFIVSRRLTRFLRNHQKRQKEEECLAWLKAESLIYYCKDGAYPTSIDVPVRLFSLSFLRSVFFLDY